MIKVIDSLKWGTNANFVFIFTVGNFQLLQFFQVFVLLFVIYNDYCHRLYLFFSGSSFIL